MWTKQIILAFALAVSSEATIYFKEQFNDEGWSSRWVTSTFPGKAAGDMGAWKHTAGEVNPADEADKGIQTSEDSRHYGISALVPEAFSSSGKDLVVQYTVKFDQKIDCGGAYIKLAAKADQASFSGDTPYQIMFGPDVCGGTRKTHVIFNYGGKNLEMKKTVSPLSDQKTHLYTLVVKADGTYEVFIDEVSKQAGKLEDGWDFLEPKEIKDPAVSKPADWVDTKKIPDPAEVKPEGYDDIPAKIPDPEATKPEDWEDEDDGEWEPPTIDNPDYKGPWKPTMIDNPEYKGEWKHPMIANPDYKEDPTLATRCVDCGMVGFELWQVKAGTIFDDIIITDSLEEAKAFAQETFFVKKDKEAEAIKKADDEKKAKAEEEKKKKEEEKKKKEEEETDSKSDDEDEEAPRDEL